VKQGRELPVLFGEQGDGVVEDLLLLVCFGVGLDGGLFGEGECVVRGRARKAGRARLGRGDARRGFWESDLGGLKRGCAPRSPKSTPAPSFEVRCSHATA